jgi:hypothetical protein
MKVAALAAIGAFIILPAEAVERHGENNSPAAICDNDGHRAALGATVPVSNCRFANWRIIERSLRAN